MKASHLNSDSQSQSGNSIAINWLLIQFSYPKSSERYQISMKFKQAMVKLGFGQTIKDSYATYGNDEKLDNLIEQVKLLLPKYGRVSILRFSDEQFGNILNFSGRR